MPKHHLDRPGALPAPWRARTEKFPRWFRDRITPGGALACSAAQRATAAPYATRRTSACGAPQTGG